MKLSFFKQLFGENTRNIEKLVYIHPNYNRKSDLGCHLFGISKTDDRNEILSNLELKKVYNMDRVEYHLKCKKCNQAIFRFIASKKKVIEFAEIKIKL